MFYLIKEAIEEKKNVTPTFKIVLPYPSLVD